MGSAPRYKVYSADGEYRAACKYVEEAAAIVALLGDGATIRCGHSAKDARWTEGVDGYAGESYDAVAECVRAKIAQGGAA